MIPIKNIYYMLSYAFQVLNEQGYKNLATEQFENTADLMAAILAKGVSIQIKRGLGKEYISQTESLSTMRGKIDIAESIKTQSMLKKQMVCDYDEFSTNGTMNRIIKSTVELLIYSGNISTKRIKELKKLMVYFTDELTGESKIPITIKGKGYHPLQFVPPPEISPFNTMPKDRMCKDFEGELIQKCAVSVEEIDFASLKDKTINKTIILYNFSKTSSLIFDFREPGFLLKDEIEIKPNKDKLEPNSHTLIKMSLSPK